MSELLERLRGGLIVSVQAKPRSPLEHPMMLGAMAAAAQLSGAVGVRIAEVANIREVQARVGLPIVGLIKREYPGFATYITPTLADVDALLETGVEIVAFDATARPRPAQTQIGAIVRAIHAGGALAMADCSCAGDGVRAAALGADILGTTLCGYTEETAGRPLPALDLLPALAAQSRFTICEGGILRPESGRAALEAGADAIVVGTAITDTGWIVGEFARALPKRGPAEA